ncbi:MAG: transglycosylase SLT domain-containing protein [bacterium]|nr:transglycosylase SLT domain-containing protein [bacterium]
MKITKTKIIFLLLLLVNLIPVFCLAADTYVPMEKIPGFEDPADFPAYLMSIYKFGLWAIGTSAMFMIMIGGYMYLTSAGNNSQTGKAKGIITDAIAGLILALVSYVLLYTINPELVQFKPLQGITSTPSSAITGTDDKTTGPSKYAGYNQACPDPTSKTPIDFSKSPATSASSVCKSLIPDDVGGISKEILRTVAELESSCGTNPKAKVLSNDDKACGIMQIKPSTAKRSCQDLISNDRLSIELAAKYIKDNTSNHKNDPVKIFAGYNSGYGTSKTPEGKLPSLAKSNDCNNALAFQCCFKPGELDESIHYAWKGNGIYKSQ